MRSCTNSISAGQLGDTRRRSDDELRLQRGATEEHDQRARWRTHRQHARTEGDEPTWLERPESMVVLGTDYQISDSLSRHASLLTLPAYYVLRPEGLVHGTKPDQKLPCHGEPPARSPPPPARSRRSWRPMATYPPTWPRKAQIFVRSENDRIKLAGLIEKHE